MEALDIELTPSPRAVAEARTAVTRRFAQLPAAPLEDLRLLITELVSNAILHGGYQEDDCIRVRVIRRHGTLHAEVFDCGGDTEVRPRPLDPRSPGGFGLHLVDEISDRWGVRHDGSTCVWFELTHGRAA